ncbi:MAG: hypothetical protein JO062_02080 [Bryobacterales bacterium]|nr:hypothetical protein [Bryobacterales bacterium]
MLLLGIRAKYNDRTASLGLLVVVPEVSTGSEFFVMQPVKGRWIVIALLAVIGVTVAIAAYVLFFKRS